MFQSMQSLGTTFPPKMPHGFRLPQYVFGYSETINRIRSR